MTKEPITMQAKPIGESKKKNQNLSSMISRFKKSVEESGILKEYRERRYYEKPSAKKRRAKKLARLNMEKQRGNELRNS